MLTDKAITMCLLEILKEYSDSSHEMTMKEILSKMESDYMLKPDRRTIYSAVATLIDFGYDISTYEENGKGYFLREREFEQSEIIMLTDAVYAFPFVSGKQSDELIESYEDRVHDLIDTEFSALASASVLILIRRITMEIYENGDISNSYIRKLQAKAAELFQTTLLGDLDEVQKTKAFAETVYKVKQSSIEMRMGRAAETGDLAAMQTAIAEQASLKTSLRKVGL